MTDASPDRVIEILARMADGYRACLNVTREAASAQSPDPDRLAAMLKERGQVLTRIADLEHGLPTEKTGGRPRLLGIPPDRRPRIEALLGEITALIEQTVEADRTLRARLEAEKSEAESGIRRSGTGQKLLKAYAPFRGIPPRFMSHRG